MPEPKRPLKVFLCHASADKPKVRELYRTLKRRGVQPWLDAENLIPGQNWEVEIPKALLSSDAIIICLSPNSIDKEGYVQKEIKFALDKALEMPEGRIFLIPAKLEECDLPFSLRQYQAVHLYEKEGYTKLMKALKLRASQLERNTVELPKEGEIILEIKKAVEEKKLVEPKQEKLEPAKPTSEKSQPRNTKSPRKPSTAIIVALIGLAGTIIAALLGSPIIEKRLSPVPVATELATATVTLTSQPVVPSKTIEPSLLPIETTSTTTSTVNCIYTVRSGDYAYGIAETFEIGGRNWKTIYCSPEDTNGCDLGNPSIMTPGWLVIIPGVNADVCTQNGGTPQSSSETNLPTEITDAKGVSMVLVPAGEFTMGSDMGEGDERPIHLVYLDSFYIDQYEVTNKLYSLCVETDSCQDLVATYSSTRDSYYGNQQFDNYPVVFVDWNMADSYCSWRGARLPTEAEWEKAARGTDERTYSWGGLISDSRLNYNHNVGDTVEVGTYPSGVSSYGVFDMSGNVWEWVSDWYDSDYYGFLGEEARNPLGPENGEYKVKRGGGWFDNSYFVRTTIRIKNRTVDVSEQTGFRCAKDATP